VDVSVPKGMRLKVAPNFLSSPFKQTIIAISFKLKLLTNIWMKKKSKEEWEIDN